MASMLVHITCGPESPTRAALGFLVARAAMDKGHGVHLFLAGDAVQLLRDAVLDSLAGLGTGKLREHFDALATGDARFYLSGMSSAARSLSPEELAGKSEKMAMPDVLVDLAFECERTLTY